MQIAFYGDSLTAGFPGVSYFRLLQARLPEDRLLNFGKPGDTALNLYTRLQRRGTLPQVDVAFLWIGGNDLLVRRSALMTRVRQQRAKTPQDFETQYRALLAMLTPRAEHVFAVSLPLIGEDVPNEWDALIAEYSQIIRQLAGEVANTTFVDVRSVLLAELAGCRTREFVPGSELVSVVDALTLRTTQQVDRRAAARGQHLTLDGVHFNSAGAALVAETFYQTLVQWRSRATA